MNKELIDAVKLWITKLQNMSQIWSKYDGIKNSKSEKCDTTNMPLNNNEFIKRSWKKSVFSNAFPNVFEWLFLALNSLFFTVH